MNKAIHPAWQNSDNNSFYNGIDTDFFQYVIKTGGIDTHIDIKMIDQALKPAQSILEIGAGSGRVLQYLTKNYYDRNIHAIERNEAFYLLLKNKYQNEVELHHADIMQFNSIMRFDAILLMFSTIAEFSSTEQPLLIKKLANLLRPQGKLVIDSFLHNDKPIQGAQITQQETAIHAENAVLHAYLPNKQELITTAKSSGLSISQSQNYQTTENRGRYSIVFQLDNT